MELKKVSIKTRQRRKFLLVLPGLVLPFLLIIFIALGGGKGKGQDSPGLTAAAGLNLRLPDPRFAAGKDADKFGLYERMDRNSGRRGMTQRLQLLDFDSTQATRLKTSDNDLESHFSRSADSERLSGVEPLDHSAATTTSERQVMEKLATLRRLINEKNGPAPKEWSSPVQPIKPVDAAMSPSHPASHDSVLADAPDPELSQLNGLLDKIQQVQHPELVADSLARVQKSHQPIYTLSRLGPFQPALLEASQGSSRSFFSADNLDTVPEGIDQTISAFVSETQTVVSGSTVRLQTTEDAQVAGSVIPKNAWIYGIASLHGERLTIQFSSIRAGHRILPVAVEAFDLDGLAGIYIPGSLNRDVAKQSLDQGLASLGMTGLDPSVAAQATAAGIQTARTLASRKIRLIRVTLPAGYRLLLKQTTEK